MVFININKVQFKVKYLIFYLIICSSFLNLSACYVFKMDTRQGNELDQKKLNQLKPQQTIEEVKEILGSTNLTQVNPKRLDYYYSLNPSRSEITKQQHLILFFDKNGELNHYDGDVEVSALPKVTSK